MRPSPVRPDASGFRWQLQPLQVMLDFQLVQATLALQSVRREHDAAGGVLQQLRSEWDGQAAAAALPAGTACDPRQRARVLAYFGALGDRIAAAGARLATRERELAAARERCLQLQRRLDGLQRVQDQARRQHLHAAQVRAERAADDAWLAQCRHGDSVLAGGAAT